jgi:hypothetical protein
MKRILVAVAVFWGVLLVLWIVTASATRIGWQRAGRAPWPANLGTIADFESRFPKRDPSAAALHLMVLARPLGIDFTPKMKSGDDAIQRTTTTYVKSEQASGELAITEPPSETAALIASHAREIDAVRDHLVQGGEIAWSMDLSKAFEAPLPNLLAHMHLHRLLVARALMRARAHDLGAWGDLQAASELGRSLHARPELVSQLVALSIARNVNAAAWKMPLPAPQWFLRPVDHERLLLRGMQGDAWLFWKHGADVLETPFAPVIRPFFWAVEGNMVAHQRRTAMELSTITACGFDAKELFDRRLSSIPRWNVIARIAMPNTHSVWSRVKRFKAEREATHNALRIRAGQPIASQSICSDGTWRYAEGWLRFSRDLPRASESETVLPLTLLQVVPDNVPARDDDLHLER